MDYYIGKYYMYIVGGWYIFIHNIHLYYKLCNRIVGVMVSGVLASSAVDREFESGWVKPKTI
jgi:hypothetical protein